MKKILTLIFFLWSSWVLAYQFTVDFNKGFYWQQLPLAIAIDPQSQHASYLHQLTKDAIRDWEQSTGKKIWELAPLGETRTHTIRWTEKFAEETAMDPLRTLAITIRYTVGPYFTKTEIVLNGRQLKFMSQQQLLTVLVHEMGHTIGLDHSEYDQAVMYANLVQNYEEPHFDDVEGMSELILETQRRQAVNYISPLAYSEEKNVNKVACGTITMDNGSGPSQFIGISLSFMMGWLLVSFSQSLRFSRIKSTRGT